MCHVFNASQTVNFNQKQTTIKDKSKIHMQNNIYKMKTKNLNNIFSASRLFYSNLFDNF